MLPGYHGDKVKGWREVGLPHRHSPYSHSLLGPSVATTPGKIHTRLLSHGLFQHLVEDTSSSREHKKREAVTLDSLSLLFHTTLTGLWQGTGQIPATGRTGDQGSWQAPIRSALLAQDFLKLLNAQGSGSWEWPGDQTGSLQPWVTTLQNKSNMSHF